MSLQGVDNVFLTDDVIMKEALRLLKNNLVAAPLVHRDTKPRFNKVGDTISLEQPYRTKTASGRTLVKQPMTDRTIPFQINNHQHFGLEINVRDRTLTLQNFSDRYLKSGIVQIANVIDRSILNVLDQGTFFGSGTPGTPLSDTAFLYARAYQTMVGVPDDGLLRAILNPLDCAEVSADMANRFNEQLVRESLQKGYRGMLGKYDTFETGNQPAHTVGAHGGTPLVAGGSQSGATLNTDGWSTSVTGILNPGDQFTIAGVFEINPQSYESTGELQRFTVTAAADSDGSGLSTLAISPAINDGSLTTVDAEGNTVSLGAYQNVTALPADNAAITVIGTADTAYRSNYCFHRDAVALCMVDLELPQSATVKSRVRDADTGLSMSMTADYDITNHSEITRIDAVWGVKMIYPELAHRIWSAVG